ncbi:MAG: hypothetical protein ACFFAJ_08885 [Candidatus Hodarchaeota archaeon]
MFESKRVSTDRKRFLYLRVIIDFLKTNGHRIAHHVMSRTPTPLASRNDIKPLIPLIDGEVADIFTLDSNSKMTFLKSVESDELIAHFSGDMILNDSLSSIQEGDLENIHFIFATNGILTPTLLQTDFINEFSSISEMTFLETRFDPESIHKIGNPSIYMRKVVGQIRKMGTAFTEIPGRSCECGGKYWKGFYKITYWGKSHDFEYEICESCGIQRESTDNANAIMTFVQGLSAE